MRPARRVVEIVRRHDLVPDSLVVILHAMLCIIALEDVEVLHGELVVLIPSYSEAFLVFVLECLRGVQQVEHLLVIDL